MLSPKTYNLISSIIPEKYIKVTTLLLLSSLTILTLIPLLSTLKIYSHSLNQFQSLSNQLQSLLSSNSTQHQKIHSLKNTLTPLLSPLIPKIPKQFSTSTHPTPIPLPQILHLFPPSTALNLQQQIHSNLSLLPSPNFRPLLLSYQFRILKILSTLHYPNISTFHVSISSHPTKENPFTPTFHSFTTISTTIHAYAPPSTLQQTINAIRRLSPPTFIRLITLKKLNNQINTSEFKITLDTFILTSSNNISLSNPL